MKTLLIYYSRTGNTRKIAEEIKEAINADIEEIVSKRNRSGFLGFFVSGKEGSQGLPAEINPISINPEKYDMVIIGTPVWASNVSSPIRQYVLDNCSKFKKVALFCTMGSTDCGKTFDEMENMCHQKSVATLAINTKEIIGGTYGERLKEFINNIK